MRNLIVFVHVSVKKIYKLMNKAYSNEKNVQILIFLLKQHNIKKVVVSPGATNVTFVGSIQNDPYFEIYSCVDERSAAYIACGLAEETGEAVVISCTGATASRNYIPAMTEAFYRKLPILAVTSSQDFSRVGHQIPQVLDRSSIQNDIAKLSVSLQNIKDDADVWDCEIKANKALLELSHHGGGPVHINLATTYSKDFSVEQLPSYRVIERVGVEGEVPDLKVKKVAVMIGSHRQISSDLTKKIERFCEQYDAVVLCDHSSNYYGKYKLHSSIYGVQHIDKSAYIPEVLIRLGDVTGDYDSYSFFYGAKEVWRVSEDGELVDTYQNLRYVFEMSEASFFSRYEIEAPRAGTSYFELMSSEIVQVRATIQELPFSNPWLAQQLSPDLPYGSSIHFGILNSLRSWNFFDLPQGVKSMSNVGGFGIDGCVSTLIGASLANSEKLYFAVVGDLAFFYDLNAIGNRHVGNNVRILLVNNGRGTEFRNYNHPAARFGEAADDYMAAAGHYGDKSPSLVKNFAQDLGFLYLSASTKQEVLDQKDVFLNPEIGNRPMIFEVFTDSEDESEALQYIHTLLESEHVEHNPARVKGFLKKALGEKGISVVKKMISKD